MSGPTSGTFDKAMPSAIGFSGAIISAGLGAMSTGDHGAFASLVALALSLVFALFLIRALAGTATLSGVTEYLFGSESEQESD